MSGLDSSPSTSYSYSKCSIEKKLENAKDRFRFRLLKGPRVGAPSRCAEDPLSC